MTSLSPERSWTKTAKDVKDKDEWVDPLDVFDKYGVDATV